MQALTLLESDGFNITVQRLCHQLIEDHGDLSKLVLIGLHPRGVHVSRRLRNELQRIMGGEGPAYGELDITFHRDDFRQRSIAATAGTTTIDVSLDERNVVLVDDVLYTGRSIRAGLDAMLSFGRPQAVQLLVLIDRRFRRELPIQPDYVGKQVDSFDDQRVSVEWAATEGADRVVLYTGARGSAQAGQDDQTERT